jgi:PadR family transcriptional regulator
MARDAWREQLRRGALEMAILLALASRPRYGLEILRHLEALGDLVVGDGTIYPILARLTRDGFLAAEWRSSEAPHPRKYYRLTDTGLDQLEAMRAYWRSFTGKIERLIRAAGEEQA